MEWSVVRLNDLSSLAARARLLSRTSVESFYNLPLEEILGLFGETLERSDRQVGAIKFEITVVASGERACACISAGDKHTIVLDLGFIELIADFLMVLGKFGDSFPVRIADLALLATEERYWPLDSERQAFKKKIEREEFGFEWEEDDLSSEVEPEHRSDVWGSIDQEDAIWNVTGSQIFRDVARKLTDSVADRLEHPEIYDAFMAWPVHHDGRSYPASCALFNHIITMVHAHDSENAALAQYFHRHLVIGSTFILLHEVSHALHPDSKVDEWLQSAEAGNIRRDLELYSAAQQRGGFYADVFDRLIEAFDPARASDSHTARAVYESFFDIRAIEMFLSANGQFLEGNNAVRFLAMIYELCARNVALLTFKEQIIVSLTEPEKLNSAGEQAFLETTKRQVLLASYFRAYIQENLSDLSIDPLDQRLEQTLDDTRQLFHFFCVDMLNGLPIFAEDQSDFQEEAARFWVEFIHLAQGQKSSA